MTFEVDTFEARRGERVTDDGAAAGVRSDGESNSASRINSANVALDPVFREERLGAGVRCGVAVAEIRELLARLGVTAAESRALLAS